MKSALIAALALALAPAAHAQVTCSELSRIAGYAEDDFDEIADEEIDDDLYESSFALPGAYECTIDYAFDSYYSCVWVYDSQAAAVAAFNPQHASMASCLAGWTRNAITPDAQATSEGYRTLEGAYYVGSGDNADLEWGVHVEEHTHAEGTDWHVTIGLAYLW